MIATMDVVIADDHPQFRSATRVMLESAGYDVIGEAGDAKQAIAECHRLHPDLLILDVQLPDNDGFAVAAELSLDADSPTIVLVSNREASDFGDLINGAHVAGFISKIDFSEGTLRALIGDDDHRR